MRRFKHKTKSYLVGGNQFKKELASQIKFLIIVTLGFTIAFTWRQTVFDITESIIKSIFTTSSLSALSILTSIAITLIAILIILLTSKYLNPKRFN